MPKYVVEHAFPGAGSLSPQQLESEARQQCKGLGHLGPDVHWIETYGVADTMYCIFYAPDEATLRRGTQNLGFAATRITSLGSHNSPPESSASPSGS